MCVAKMMKFGVIFLKDRYIQSMFCLMNTTAPFVHVVDTRAEQVEDLRAEVLELSAQMRGAMNEISRQQAQLRAILGDNARLLQENTALRTRLDNQPTPGASRMLKSVEELNAIRLAAKANLRAASNASSVFNQSLFGQLRRG
jgi:regulator of replication initiation timing